jgi:hypothetical protein
MFKDHGIGLEFKDKERLAEFFQKERELYPDFLRATDRVFVSGGTRYLVTLLRPLIKPFYSCFKCRVAPLRKE